MKNWIFGLLVIGISGGAALCQESPVIDTPGGKVPVVVTLTSASPQFGSDSYAGFDGNNVVRIMVHQASNFRRGFYEYYNSAVSTNWTGAKVSTVELTDARAKRIALIVSKASPQCPVTLTLDQHAFHILKIASPCDELQ